jgi:hypothetical protein
MHALCVLVRGGDRFGTGPDEFERVRGPGSYNLPTTIQPCKSPNRRNVMLSGAKRFGPNFDKLKVG